VVASINVGSNWISICEEFGSDNENKSGRSIQRNSNNIVVEPILLSNTKKVFQVLVRTWAVILPLQHKDEAGCNHNETAQ
jgi:hypothetical protein